MASTETYKTPYGQIVEQESSDEEEDGIPYQEKLHSSIYLCRMTSRGKLVWSKPIDDVGHQDAALQAEASKDLKRSLLQLPCHKYRSLLPSPLPPVDGDGPPTIRDDAWLRRTMRSILVRAVDVEKAASNSADPSSVICFPVLAYRFFDSSDRNIEATRLVEGLSLCSDPDQAKRDDDRWALYHGIRKMMVDDDDAEASLFFELLDESNGQDVLAFVLQVLIEVDDAMKESILSSSSDSTNPDPVLLPLPLALELTSNFFASGRVCTESQGLQSADLDALTKKTMDLATEESGENGKIELYVDLFQWLVLVPAREYCREVNRRKSLARLLFETASTGTLSSYEGPKSEDKSEGEGINFPQFESVMQVLWRGISRNEIDELYSLAYEFQRTIDKYDGFGGVSLEAFLHVADKRRFFARSRR
jgi:hypothetical protein